MQTLFPRPPYPLTISITKPPTFLPTETKASDSARPCPA